jgi:hypothetical protein
MSVLENKENLLAQYFEQLAKAIKHLEYSYAKIQKITTDPNKLSEEELETWESFSARFARVVDIYTSKLIRLKVEIEYPGFEGSVKDYLNKAEQMEILDNAEKWASLKELRNIIAHEYAEKSLQIYFNNLLRFTPTILELKKWIIK